MQGDAGTGTCTSGSGNTPPGGSGWTPPGSTDREGGKDSDNSGVSTLAPLLPDGMLRNNSNPRVRTASGAAPVHFHNLKSAWTVTCFVKREGKRRKEEQGRKEARRQV